MGASEKFSSFCNNIRIDPVNVSSIQTRYGYITKRLNLEYYGSDSKTLHSLYVGSYGRDTEIHVSDIDMIFVLPTNVYYRFNAYSGNGQSALLQEVKNKIALTYPTTHLKGDGQVISINFSDGIKFEVVPVFNHSDGSSYIYADSNYGGSWKVTKPRAEISAIKTMNDQCNKNLKRLSRMVRNWRDHNNINMGGLLIDTLCYNFIKDYVYKDRSYFYYDYFTRDFFQYLSEQNVNQDYWLAPGSNQYVFKKDNFVYKARQAYLSAVEAIQFEQENNESSANQKWRDIYGNRF